MHKYNIQYIVDHGTPAEMVELKELMDAAICELKMVDKDAYMRFEYELQKLAHHCHMSEELAKAWTSKMINRDGTTGPHWTYEQTEQVRKDKGLTYHPWDFYAALNMVYSDYYSPKFSIETYLDLTKDWLDDEDAGKAKILKYYFFVVRGD